MDSQGCAAFVDGVDLRPQSALAARLATEGRVNDRTLTTVVVTQKEGFLVSAEVDEADYARGTRPLQTRQLSLLSFHPLGVVTGFGFSWVQAETPAAHELKGLTIMPVFLRLELGQTLVIDRALHEQALAYFQRTDPAYRTREVRGLLLEVSTGQGALQLNLKAECHPADAQDEWTFRIIGLVPSGRTVQSA